MSRRCRECEAHGLEIIGMGEFKDTVLVECAVCGAEYEVEPDGLDEGCMEMVEARIKHDMRKERGEL